MAATQVQLALEVARTPESVRRRYLENCDWRLYPKEWIYKNISVRGLEVLDFGCGTGEISSQLALLGAKRVYALDVTQGLLEQTRCRAELDGVGNQVETVCGMIQDLAPHPVDVIVAFAVLHHCFPLERIMPALLGWLKPGGTFAAVEPICHSPLLDWMRRRSGIPTDALDEGERQLTRSDTQYITSLLANPKIIYFHLLGRLARLWPNQDKLFRKIDRRILPMASRFAGTALITGY